MAKPKKAEQANTVVYCGPSIPGVHRIHQRDPHRAGGVYREAAGHGGPGGAPGAVTGGHEEPAERHGAYFPPVSSGTGQTLNRR